MIDQGLKERLTGAVVLILLGVIFIPLFLDGPDATSTDSSSRTLVLPGVAQEAPDREIPASRRNAGEAQDQPAAPAQEVKTHDKAANAASAPPATVVSKTPENPLSAWAVQVGSFTSQDNAERLSAALKKRGYRAFVTRLSAGEKPMYRVRVGPEQQRERAEQLAARLKKEGQEANVVSHP
ncbi:MAG: hypothetical protein HKN59_04580 [Gammaproteobacteria bacterium]|nr:hypothetical protein [Gammaproteobacteria bacterium]